MHHYHFQQINRKENYGFGEINKTANENATGHLVDFGEKEKKYVGENLDSVFLDKNEMDSSLKKRVNKILLTKTLKQQVKQNNKKKKIMFVKKIMIVFFYNQTWMLRMVLF